MVHRVHPKVSFVIFYLKFSQQLRQSVASLQAFLPWTFIGALMGRHGYEARDHEAEAKPKPLLNHEAEAEAKALTFGKARS